MAEIEIRLPKMGESVTEATITNWLKNPGDKVSMDEPLVEVATDKVDNELPSEAEGVLIKQLFEKDEVAQVGDVIAIISSDVNAKADDTSKPEPIVTPKVQETVDSQTPDSGETLIAPNSKQNGSESLRISKSGSKGQFFSPLVRSIAQKEGISQSDLENIVGSGAEGRVTKKDVLAHLTKDVTATPKNKPASNVQIGRAHV